MPGRPAGTGLLLERSAPGDEAIVVLFANGGETRGARGNGRPGRRGAAGPGAPGTVLGEGGDLTGQAKPPGENGRTGPGLPAGPSARPGTQEPLAVAPSARGRAPPV